MKWWDKLTGEYRDVENDAVLVNKVRLIFIAGPYGYWEEPSPGRNCTCPPCEMYNRLEQKAKV